MAGINFHRVTLLDLLCRLFNRWKGVGFIHGLYAFTGQNGKYLTCNITQT